MLHSKKVFRLLNFKIAIKNLFLNKLTSSAELINSHYKYQIVTGITLVIGHRANENYRMESVSTTFIGRKSLKYSYCCRNSQNSGKMAKIRMSLS